MITKRELLDVIALKSRAERRTQGRFIVEGLKCVQELLKRGEDRGIEVKRIYAVESQMSLQDEPWGSNADWQQVGQNEMDRMSQLKNAPGLLAVASMPGLSGRKVYDALGNLPASPGEPVATPRKDAMPVIVVLDGIQDPGNAGAIIRAAAWFEASGILFTKGSVDPYGAKTVQASMGSVFQLPISELERETWLEQAAQRNIPIDVLDLDGEPLEALGKATVHAATGARFLVIGSESHGPHALTKSAARGRYTIPGGGAESLNAAMAASVALYALHLLRKG